MEFKSLFLVKIRFFSSYFSKKVRLWHFMQIAPTFKLAPISSDFKFILIILFDKPLK